MPRGEKKKLKSPLLTRIFIDSPLTSLAKGGTEEFIVPLLNNNFYRLVQRLYANGSLHPQTRRIRPPPREINI